MIKRIILFIAILQTISTFGQIEIAGNFYSLDSAETGEDWLITGDKLFYTEISKDWSTIWFAAFPIEFIQENDTLPDCMRFQFTDMDSSIFSNSKLTKKTDCFKSELKFTNQFNGQGKIILTKEISIKIVNKETIMLNDIYFKLDSKLKIFQRFTGY
jgi:hypothetical protein